MPLDQKITDCINIHALPSLELKACWVLNELSSGDKTRFTVVEVANYLVEKIGFSTNRQAVEAALRKSKNAIHKDGNGYKLMQPGIENLHKHLDADKVVFIDSNKPFSAKNYTLKDILGTGHKEIVLCDPYVDQNTLDVIFNNFEKTIPIRVLTANVVEKLTGIFKRQLTELQAEGFNIEVRIYKSSTLHDRYIISDKNFWLSGNSLNFLGKKESFIVLLGEDIRQNMLANFNSRWKVSIPI